MTLNLIRKTFTVMLLCAATITAVAQSTTWKGATLANGKYHLYNIATQLFVNADGRLRASTPVLFEFTEQEGGLYTLTAEEGALTISITTKSGNAITGGGQALPTAVNVGITDGTAIALTFEGDASAYTISTTTTWKYYPRALSGSQEATYTAYLSASEPAEGEATTTYTADGTADAAQWMLITEGDYAKSAAARNDALQRLSDAIELAENTQKQLEKLPGLNQLSFTTTIASAKTMRNNASSVILGALITTNAINDMADKLTDMSASMLVMSDYYLASLSAISDIEEMSQAIALRALTTTARTSLNAATTTGAMNTAMTTLRAGVIAWIKAQKTLPDNTSLTGLIGNQGFETGDLNNWFMAKIDLSGFSLSDITAILNQDLGKLAKYIKFEADEGTRVMRNDADLFLEGASDRYYLDNQKSQLIMQTLIGLPEGTYRLAADVASSSDIHVNVVVVPGNLVSDALGSAIANGNINLAESIGTILKDGKLLSNKTKGAGKTIFTNASLEFSIEEGDLVLLSLNAGTLQFVGNIIGNASYKADNVTLTYLHSNMQPTVIRDVNHLSQTTQRYNISGQRITGGGAHGIEIVGGKKVVR